MSFVRPTVSKSSRVFGIVLIIFTIAIVGFASKWSGISVYAETFGRLWGAAPDAAAAEPRAAGFNNSSLILTPGTCDTAGPIEVEGPTPTAYATLGAAFTAINAGTHTGTITIDVCGDTNEGTATATLNASGAGAASYTSITMKPAGGAARTISGATTAGSPMIDFNGADNVTVDGLNTGGNSLTISNTTASATTGTATIRFIGGATGNTITNSTLLGSVASSVATNGATVFFSTDAVTANGNDNNTISNNNIGPAGANLPTKAILGNGSTTTTAIGNSGNVIDNNNIFDYFGAAVTSAGIATNGGCNAWTITNNRFYQTATRTWTTGSLHNAINIGNTTATSGAQGFTITGNIVGYASNTQTGTYTLTGAGTGAKFVGILFSGIVAGTTTNVNNNTVAAVSMTGVTGSGTTTASPFTAILLQEGNIVSNGNTVGSQSATGSLTFSTTTTSSTDVYGIHNFTSNAWTANNNTVGGISVTNLGASGTFLLIGMRAFTGSTATWNAASNTVGGSVSNSIQLSATGTSSQVEGMFTSNAPAVLTSNTVRNLTTNIGTGTTASASVIGINITATSPNHTLSQNTIFNLSNTNATAASVVTGLQFTGATANTVERNLIYGITAATNSLTAEVNGIRVAGGTTQYRNNMIALGAGIDNALGGTAANGSTTGVNGINEALGTDQFFHNSVYIGGSPTAGTGASYAFNGTQTTNTRSFRDNIFFNARNNSGASGKNYAIKINGTAANPTGLTINNNLYFANGTGAVFGFFNSLDVANLAAWKTAVGQDAASFESNPQYLAPAAATPDLHLNAAVATVAEGNGVDVGVTLDFDGQTRSALTPVDIGADAGNYIGLDVSAPVITYTPLGNTSSTANRIQTVTLTDTTGVATGGSAPRIYFNKNAGTYSSTACALASGTVNSGTWNCTIDYSLLGGVAVADVIRYYVVAQDTLGNLAANPNAGFAGTNVNTVTTAPTTPNQYSITGTISGSLNVGTGETYTSLTNTGGVFEAINNNEVTGNITINVTSDLTAESGTVALNSYAAGFSILIKPSGGVRTITSTAAATVMIRLSGANNVTIDGSLSGGTDRSLNLVSTGTTSPSVVLFGSVGTTPITNGTLKNCVVVNGLNTSSAVVISDAATVGSAGFFNGITIQNNDIQKAFVGAFATGGTTPANGANLVYTQNTLNTSGANAIRNVGLYMQGVNGATVTNNTVGSFNTTNDENDVGIWLATGTINATVSGNTVSTIGYTGTGAFAPIGINVTSSVAATNNLVARNTVSAISTSGGTQVRGIVVAGATSDLVIERNSVTGVNNTNTGTFGAYGIDISGGNNIAVRNNFVSNITGDMTGGSAFSTTFGIFGIRVGAGTGHVIAGNSVNLYGARAGTATTSLLTAALGVVATTSTGMDIRNNILANNITGGTTSVANVAVFLPSAGTSAMNLTWNNNSYYYGTDAARAGAGQVGTTAGTNFFTTLPALAAYTGTLSPAATNDNASIASTGAVPFATASDLHITAAAPEFNTGATVPSVTNDFDGETRPQGAAYDIGADEVSQPGTVQFSAATYSVTEGTPTVTLTVTRTGGSGGAATVNYTLGGGTATGTAACGTPGEDYVNAGGSVSFADGDAASKTFTVPICNDAVYEAAQTFDATLSIGSGSVTLGTPNPATVTINNDDAAPTVAIGDVAQAEGNAGTTNFGFGITVTGASEVTAGFLIASADGTASAPSDYTALVTTAVSAPADVNRTVTTYGGLAISVNGDTTPEPNETFLINVTTCTDCTIADNQAVGTILNDDLDTAPPTVTYAPLSNIAATSNRTFNVTATDNVGVTAVTVVWANNSGVSGSVTNPCTFVSGTTWSCTIAAGFGVPPQTSPGTVSYYVSADDAAGNSSANPAGGTIAGGTRNLFTVGSGGTIDVSVINTFDNLVVGDGFTLNGNATVNGTLTLAGGQLNTGANTLTLGCSAVVTGAGGANYVVGTVEKQFCAAGSFSFPVGTTPDNAFAGKARPTGPGFLPPPEFTPVDVNVTAGGFPVALTATVVDGTLVGANPTESVSRYWDITKVGAGVLTADLTFHYLDQDIVGTETGFNVLRRSGSTTADYPGSTVNAGANTATAPNVSAFSLWGVGRAVPTAANAEIAGRVTTGAGEGIRNATVMVTGGSLTEPRFVRTGSFGNYRITDLPVGENYVVTVISKRYVFANPSRVISLVDNVADADFTADSQ
ncbi:MAG: hypothetical protein JSS81_02415 [Acidobacteria bacterium]|nr:hypothetical protein [Acidobacteriota bacterium]